MLILHKCAEVIGWERFGVAFFLLSILFIVLMIETFAIPKTYNYSKTWLFNENFQFDYKSDERENIPG